MPMLLFRRNTQPLFAVSLVFSWDAQEPCESTNDYDYMSDSDLDDADDADEAITTQSIPEVFEKTSTQTQLVSSTGEELPAATVKSISSSGSLEVGLTRAWRDSYAFSCYQLGTRHSVRCTGNDSFADSCF